MPLSFRKTVLGVEGKMYLFSLLIEVIFNDKTMNQFSSMLNMLRLLLRSRMLQFTMDWALVPHGCIVFCCPAQWKVTTEDDKGNFFFASYTSCEQRLMEKGFLKYLSPHFGKGGKMLVNSSLVGFCWYRVNHKTDLSLQKYHTITAQRLLI